MRRKTGMKNCIDGEMRLEYMSKSKYRTLIILRYLKENLIALETFLTGKIYLFWLNKCGINRLLKIK